MDDNFDEQLITQVEQFDLIYNKTNPLFKDKRAKENAWRTIANNVDADVNRCQQRWTVLRNRYGNEKRIIRTLPSGSSRNIRPQWIHFLSMGFLDRYMATRKTTTNMPKIRCSNEAVLEEETSSMSPSSPLFTLTQVTDVNEERNETDNEESQDVRRMTEPEEYRTPEVAVVDTPLSSSGIGVTATSETISPKDIGQLRTDVRKRKQSKQELESLSHNMNEAVKQFGQILAKENNNTVNEMTDPELAFGRTVALNLKLLPQNKRIKIQAEIMNLIAMAVDQ